MVWIPHRRKRAQMSATHPGADIEYSRAQGPSGAFAAVLASALLGALLLVVAQFTTLYEVHIASAPGPIKSVGTGSNHAYSLVPIALLAALLAYVAFRQRSRPALVALGLLGVVALVLTLAVDLPDAQKTGEVLRGGHYIQASSTPSAGLYMETLGSVALLIACGVGLLMGGRPERRGG
jgi:hypothetical protein